MLRVFWTYHTYLGYFALQAVSPEFKFIARRVILSLAVWMDVRLNR